MFGEGQIDRSATGSGVTARMAVDAARGLVGPGGRRRFAGASGVVFEGALLSQEGIGASGTCGVRVSGAVGGDGLLKVARGVAEKALTAA